jgi:hypothetical protein
MPQRAWNGYYQGMVNWKQKFCYAKIPNNPTFSYLFLLFFFQYIIQLIINNFTTQHIVEEYERFWFLTLNFVDA